MRAPRFFSPTPLQPDAEIALDAEAARHAARALRLTVGAEVVLFDGRGGEYTATLIAVERGRVVARTGPRNPIERESPVAVSLAQGLAKGERMDLIVQKAVELGVAELHPVLTERCEVRLDAQRASKRLARWHGVAQAACEQCGRNRLPTIHEPIALDVWLSRATTGVRLVLDPAAHERLGAHPVGADGVTMLIGPEGGLSQRELDDATRAGYLAVRLGPRVMRTETAALAALVAIQTIYGDMARR